MFAVAAAVEPAKVVADPAPRAHRQPQLARCNRSVEPEHDRLALGMQLDGRVGHVAPVDRFHADAIDLEFRRMQLDLARAARESESVLDVDFETAPPGRRAEMERHVDRLHVCRKPAGAARLRGRSAAGAGGRLRGASGHVALEPTRSRAREAGGDA